CRSYSTCSLPSSPRTTCASWSGRTVIAVTSGLALPAAAAPVTKIAAAARTATSAAIRARGGIDRKVMVRSFETVRATVGRLRYLSKRTYRRHATESSMALPAGHESRRREYEQALLARRLVDRNARSGRRLVAYGSARRSGRH